MELNSQTHAPAALPWGKIPTSDILNRRLGGSQNRSGHFEEINICLSLLGSDVRVCPLVA